MRYSATVAPKHPKLETPQAENGIRQPTNKGKKPSINFLTKFTNTFCFR